MNALTLQIHFEGRWHDAASIQFVNRTDVKLEYDIDYATQFLGLRDQCALSLAFPVDMQPYRGPIPGFILDLIPQGDPLKRILARYQIAHSEDYGQILKFVPLAAPGNIRIKEPWIELDKQKQSYKHKGFRLQDIIRYNTEFIHYMEEHGAPIGGTSGAGGGSPKFLLRQDANGFFHAEGMLDDAKTSKCYLVKFPYTDHQNSILLSKVEKYYYEILRQLPLVTGADIELHGDILFISRFDRIKDKNNIQYCGLESLYSAHNSNIHGARLLHESNIELIHRFSTDPTADILEYLKRDLMNKMLANSDNHGRNTAFLKCNHKIRLSPLYDVTAMKFFTADFVIELTQWREENRPLSNRLNWVSEQFKIPIKTIRSDWQELLKRLGKMDITLKKHRVPQDFIDRSKQDRDDTIRDMEFICRS